MDSKDNNIQFNKEVIFVRIKNKSNRKKNIFLFDYLTDSNKMLGKDISGLDFDTSFYGIDGLFDNLSGFYKAEMLFKAITLKPFKVGKLRIQSNSIKQLSEYIKLYTLNTDGTSIVQNIKPLRHKKDGQLIENIIDIEFNPVNNSETHSETHSDKNSLEYYYLLDSTALMNLTILPNTEITLNFFGDYA